MKGDSEDVRSRLVFLLDAINGLSKEPLPLVPNAVTHIERKGPLVIGYVVDNGQVLRTVTGLTAFTVRARLGQLLGRKL